MKETKWYKSIQRFFVTLKPMRWTERIEHIFSYYKELVFVVSFLLVVAIAIGITVSGNDKQVIFGGAFVNVDINQIGYDYLSDGVMTLYSGDPETQCVELSSTAFQEVTKMSELDYSYNAAMKPISKIEAGTLDYMFMDEEGMEFYMTQYALMDLTEIFTEDELAALEEDLIYIYLEKEQIRYPIAVEVTELPFCQSCVEVSNPVYFGFTGTEKDREEYRAFWDYLNSWEGDAE